MKIGLYDRDWGSAIHGGSMLHGTMAEALTRDGYDVTIVHHRDRVAHEQIAEAFDLDLAGIRFRRVEAEGGAGLDRELSGPYDLFVDNTGGALPRVSHARRGVLVVQFPWFGYESYFGHDTDAWRAQPAPLRAARGWLHARKWARHFAGYQRVIAISEYTREWIGRRWKVDSTLVYPSARVGRPPAGAKQPLILSLGRLYPDKKPDLMIDAFRRLVDGGLRGWRFALVGGSMPHGEAARFVDSLRQAAEGYPIDVLTDLPGAELSRLLGEASLFWHAKGYGIDAAAVPQVMEHFGIATVEAMAAGAVPLVFRGGGQPEIVRQGVDGLLWDTPDELVEETSRLIGDDGRRGAMARSAVDRAAHFSKDAFCGRFLEAMAPALAP